MGHLKYVALSDLHLGSKDSLLTGLNPNVTSPVTKRFAQCLRTIIRDCSSEAKQSKPALVLHGDIIDLAMSSTLDASLAFEQFIEELIPSGTVPFSQVILIPGNHDHHLWESANATKYLRDICPGKPLKEYPHATKIFCSHNSEYQKSEFLVKSLIHQHNPHLPITIAYPSFGEFCDDKSRCVIFDHGHYTERVYYLLSELASSSSVGRQEITPEQIEKGNWSWIDFVWSSFGEGAKGVSNWYSEAFSDSQQFFLEGRSTTERASLGICRSIFYDLRERLDNLLQDYKERFGRSMMRWLLRKIVQCLGKERTKSRGSRAIPELTRTGVRGLMKYVSPPLTNQIRAESLDIPEITFIFGHTHKPFLAKVPLDSQTKLLAYNTGGWIVETQQSPLYGAALVLVDENLDAVWVQLYRDTPDLDSVRVKTLGGDTSPFFKRVLDSVRSPTNVEPWRAFREEVREQIALCRSKRSRDR